MFIVAPAEPAPQDLDKGLLLVLAPTLNELIRSGFRPWIGVSEPGVIKIVLFREVSGVPTPVASMKINAREGTVRIYTTFPIPQMISERLPRGYFEIVITPEGNIRGFVIPLHPNLEKVELTMEELKNLLERVSPLVRLGELTLAYLTGRLEPLLPMSSEGLY